MTSRTRTVFGSAALSMVAATAVQFLRVRDGYPWFEDLDASGEFGDPELPLIELLLLGDSTCTGNGLNGADEIWVRQLVPHLTKRCRLRIRSLAVGGVKIRHVLEEQLPKAVEDPGDVAFVSIGGNDALRAGVGPIMERQLDAVVSGLIDAGHLVVLSGAGDMGTPPRAVHPFQTLLTWRSIMTDRVHDRVAARYPEARKVPMWDTAPEFRSRDNIWAPDLFHPNREGHKIWADVIAPHLAGAIDDVLARRAAAGDGALH